MKVISIRQPWATLIAKGYKVYEFRSWSTKYRGDILIHASKSIEKEKIDRFKHLGITEYPVGRIIAKVNITDCIKVYKQFEDDLIKKNECIYGATRNGDGYAFKLENVHEINDLKLVKGKLGIWEYENKQ